MSKPLTHTQYCLNHMARQTQPITICQTGKVFTTLMANTTPRQNLQKHSLLMED